MKKQSSKTLSLHNYASKLFMMANDALTVWDVYENPSPNKVAAYSQIRGTMRNADITPLSPCPTVIAHSCHFFTTIYAFKFSRDRIRDEFSWELSPDEGKNPLSWDIVEQRYGKLINLLADDVFIRRDTAQNTYYYSVNRGIKWSNTKDRFFKELLTIQVKDAINGSYRLYN